jgi:hypothetical protein
MTLSISLAAARSYGKEIGGDLYERKRTSMLSRLFGTDVLVVITLPQP